MMVCFAALRLQFEGLAVTEEETSGTGRSSFWALQGQRDEASEFKDSLPCFRSPDGGILCALLYLDWKHN